MTTTLAPVDIPLRTGSGLNGREHYMARARRVKAERQAAAWALHGRPAPDLPCTVLLTRIAPSVGLDDDNLVGALKGVRDAVAEWLGVDDRCRDIVRYRYEQASGPWGVQVGFESR